VVLAFVFFACGAGHSGSKPGPGTAAEVDLAEPTTAASDNVLAAGKTSPSRDVGPSSTQIPVTADDAVWGAANAPVTIVYFTDFQCPFCTRAHATVEQLKRDYGHDKLRLVTKHHPLPFHQDALPAAIAAQAVYELRGIDAFDRYTSALFQGQRSLTDENLLGWALDVGVDQRELIDRVRDPRLRSKVERDTALAQSIGATGTPAFRINGVTLVGAQPAEKFRELIDAELAAARKLRDEGTSPEQIYARRVRENFVPYEKGAPPSEPKVDTTVYKVPVGKSPSVGPADALVTVVEFTDFECPFCRRVQPTLTELKAKFPGKIRFVFKHNPLPFHSGARPAAALSLEARTQKGDKGFFEATQALFAVQTPIDRSALLGIAKELKLNETRVSRALDKSLHDAAIQVDQDLADDLEARGTPHFFINGRRLAGAQPLERFEALVSEELTKAEALVKAGTPKSRVYAETIKDGKGPKPPETKNLPKPTKAQPSRGTAWAPVVLQVFSDFQCPFCQRVEPTLEAIEKEFPGKVRIVWRNLPLPFHKDARPAAAAAMEAFAQKGNKGFWAMHKLMFANQKALKRADLEGYAAQIGLDMARFNKALDDGRHEASIQADENLAKAEGIKGTPSIVINGYFVSGAQTLVRFKKVIRLALTDLKQGKKRP
jgi:protein-disulfide isomerase